MSNAILATLGADDWCRYDWIKAKLLKMGMKDDIKCHSMASFAAVSCSGIS